MNEVRINNTFKYHLYHFEIKVTNFYKPKATLVKLKTKLQLKVSTYTSCVPQHYSQYTNCAAFYNFIFKFKIIFYSYNLI